MWDFTDSRREANGDAENSGMRILPRYVRNSAVYRPFGLCGRVYGWLLGFIIDCEKLCHLQVTV